jgi:hypothetical protein
MRPPKFTIYQYSQVRAIQKAETVFLLSLNGIPGLWPVFVSVHKNIAMAAYYRPGFPGVNEKISIV